MAMTMPAGVERPTITKLVIIVMVFLLVAPLVISQNLSPT